MMASAGGGGYFMIESEDSNSSALTRAYKCHCDGDHLYWCGYVQSNPSVTGLWNTAYINKISLEDGTSLWETGGFTDVNTGYDSFAQDAGVDSSGNVYVAIQGKPSTGTKLYANLAKFNSSGSLQWIKSTGDNGASYYIGVTCAVSPSGNIVLSGYRRYNTLTPAIQGYSIIYNSSGSKVDDAKFQGTGSNNSFTINDEINSLGNWVSLTGTKDGGQDYYTMLERTLDANQTIQKEAHFLPSPAGDFSTYIQNSILAIDSNDDVLAMCSRIESGLPKCSIVKYDRSTGSVAWAREYSKGTTEPGALYGDTGSATTYGGSVCVDSNDNVYIVAPLRGTQYTKSFMDVAKFNSSGTLQWSNRIFYNTQSGNGDSVDVGTGINIFCDSNDDIVLAFNGRYASGNNPYAMCAIKMPNDGSLTGSFTTALGYPLSIYSLTSGTDFSIDNGTLIRYSTSGLTYTSLGAVGFNPINNGESTETFTSISLNVTDL